MKHDPSWQEPGGDAYPTTRGPLVADGDVKVLCPECVAALPAAWYDGAPLADPLVHDVCDVCMRRVVPVVGQPMQTTLDGGEVPHVLDVVREPVAVQLAMGDPMGTVDAPSLFDAPEVVGAAAPVLTLTMDAADLLDADGSWIGPGAWYVVGYSAPEQGGSGVQWFATRADAEAEATRQRLKRCGTDPKARNVVRVTDPRHRTAERARAWDAAAAGERVHGCRNGTFAFGAAVDAVRAIEARDDANGYGPLGSEHPAARARRADEVERMRQVGAEREGRIC